VPSLSRQPRYDRDITLVEPGVPSKSASGFSGRTSPTEHPVRAARVDLTAAERIASGLALNEQTTRFLVRRGDVPRMPSVSWQVRDDRSEVYSVISVNVAHGRRDLDPSAALTLLCTTTRGS